MKSISSFRDVIGLWISPGALARSIGAPSPMARKWAQRDNIPAEWWVPILATDVAKAAGLSAEIMAELAARKSQTVPALAEGRTC